MPSLREIARRAGKIPARSAALDPGLPRLNLAMPKVVYVFTRTEAVYAQTRPCLNYVAYVLIINVRGSGMVIIESRPVRLNPGQALMIFPDQSHSYQRLHPGPQFWIYISFQLPGDPIPAEMRHAPFRLTSRHLIHIQRIVADFANYRRATPLFSARICVNLWLLLLSLTADSAPLPGQRHASRSHRPDPNRTLLKVHRYIIANLSQPIRIKDLARHVNLTPRILRQLCRDILDKSPGRFVNQLRLSYAGELINFSDATFKAIAQQCGYSSVNAFGLAFKRETGYSPGAFRQFIQKKMGRKL